MGTSSGDYVELGYEPSKDDLIAFFYVEPTDKKIANKLGAESSTGTWTHLKTVNKERKEALKARAFDIDKKNNIIKIAYKHELFEEDSIPQMLSDFAGNVFGMKAVDNLRLLDVKFPEPIVKSFPGPSVGFDAIRNKLGIEERPLVGTIVKPKVGLNPEQHAKVAYEAWKGGCDLVKSDENLTDQGFCNFRERARKTLELKRKAEEETGEKKIYAENITAPFDEMVKRAEFVKEQGGNCLMVDILTAGFSAVQSIAERFPEMIIYGHRAMHAAFTRKKKHGMRMLVLAKLARLAGVEHLHTGTAVGKMEGKAENIKEIDKALKKDWYGLKKTIPVKSGGLHPGLIPELMEIFGKDIQVTAGGGIAGHPEGVISGAKAMRQAVDSVMKGIDIEEYAKDHKALQQALDEWGTRTYK